MEVKQLIQYRHLEKGTSPAAVDLQPSAQPVFSYGRVGKALITAKKDLLQLLDR